MDLFYDPLTEEAIRRNLDEDEEIEGEALADLDLPPVVLVSLVRRKKEYNIT